MTATEATLLALTSINTLMAAYAIVQRKKTIDFAIRKHDAKMAKKASKKGASHPDLPAL